VFHPTKFFRSFGRYGLIFTVFSIMLDIGAPASFAVGNQTGAPSAILEVDQHPGTLVGLQYENFFTPHNVGDFSTAEAIPVLGKYSSYDVGVIRKHEEWFESLGIDWLLLDWSNMLWSHPEWERHEDATREIEETTALLFQTYRQMKREGKHPPKLVIMLGLQNGRLIPNDVERLNGIIAWLKANFLDQPEYKDLWLYYHGKPLLIVLFHTKQTCAEADQHSAGVVAPDWTVRWMAAQLQDTHMENCGFWSWMDGTIRQIVTRREGKAEETVVAPACFPYGHGWLDPKATGRDHGVPYLRSWEVAFESHPKLIQIHQWNEFAGQAEGKGFGPAHDLYGDEYNVNFSDDIEPTQLAACAYRGCGGWGYYYMNLTKAILSLYREETPDITVLALSGPIQPVVKDKELPLEWKYLGARPKSFTLKLDGRVVAEKLLGNGYNLPLTNLPPGKHRVTLTARGVHTYFDLSSKQPATRSRKPLPVTSEIEINIAR
jgi:hypothetical protein